MEVVALKASSSIAIIAPGSQDILLKVVLNICKIL